MSISTFSSRQFNQDVGSVKRAAMSGPVFITDRGQAALAVLCIEDYKKITDTNETIGDLLAMPGAETVDFDPPRLKGDLYKPEDFS